MRSSRANSRQLPAEVWLETARQLNIPDLERFCGTSRAFSALCKSSLFSSLWHEKMADGGVLSRPYRDLAEYNALNKTNFRSWFGVYRALAAIRRTADLEDVAIAVGNRGHVEAVAGVVQELVARGGMGETSPWMLPALLIRHGMMPSSAAWAAMAVPLVMADHPLAGYVVQAGFSRDWDRVDTVRLLVAIARADQSEMLLHVGMRLMMADISHETVAALTDPAVVSAVEGTKNLRMAMAYAGILAAIAGIKPADLAQQIEDAVQAAKEQEPRRQHI